MSATTRPPKIAALPSLIRAAEDATPAILVLNKIDLLADAAELQARTAEFREIVPVRRHDDDRRHDAARACPT